ncbi:MAG: DinB family protein [Gemmatimonadota bacterium]
MRPMKPAGLSLFALLAATAAGAQSAPTDYRDEFLNHFERSSAKITQLADAMPETLYAWSPGEGVMSVERVYAHIARYNYMYLEENLGIPAPEAIDLGSLESTTGKGEVTELLRHSIDHVREHASALTEEGLNLGTTLYGREVAGWAVLFQLLAHMNEHVGQSVAYARMNGIVPPWSR